MRYGSKDLKVIFFSLNGEANEVAECNTAAHADIAADLLEKSFSEQSRRNYTKAARLLGQATDIEGFRWINGADDLAQA